MTKEKQASLSKYVQDLKNRLSSPLPEKHRGRREAHELFLLREITKTQSKLDEAKLMEGSTK